ncbi:MAG: hypothetical protein AB8V05_05500 [Francisella endosymbiont of Hyalomma scupense]
MVNFLSNRKISIKKYTNVLITINQEDYNIAKDKFRAKNTKLINDVGTNLGKLNHYQFMKNYNLEKSWVFKQMIL